jgi:hypothetical protein
MLKIGKEQRLRTYNVGPSNKQEIRKERKIVMGQHVCVALLIFTYKWTMGHKMTALRAPLRGHVHKGENNKDNF